MPGHAIAADRAFFPGSLSDLSRCRAYAAPRRTRVPCGEILGQSGVPGVQFIDGS